MGQICLQHRVRALSLRPSCVCMYIVIYTAINRQDDTDSSPVVNRTVFLLFFSCNRPTSPRPPSALHLPPSCLRLAAPSDVFTAQNDCVQQHFFTLSARSAGRLMEEIKVLKCDLIRRMHCITIRAPLAAAFHPFRFNRILDSAPTFSEGSCLPFVLKDLN